VYVVDGEEKLIGSIPVMDLAAVLKEHKDGGSPWPTHLLHAQHPRVSDATPLWELLETFARHTGERLPVIDGNGKLLGHITKTSLLMILSERTGLR
jgi:CIC family chloride channel protein